MWIYTSIVMLMCFCQDVPAKSQMPQEIIGNWCLAFDKMIDRYVYGHCEGSNVDVMVRQDGFDAQETACDLHKIEWKKTFWLASFRCADAGLEWVEDDEIRIVKNGWTLKAMIRNAHRVGDPPRYCLMGVC